MTVQPLKFSKPKTMVERDARYMWLVDTIGWPYEGAFELRPEPGYYSRNKWSIKKQGLIWCIIHPLKRFFFPPKLWYYFKTEEDKALFKRYLKTIKKLK